MKATLVLLLSVLCYSGPADQNWFKLVSAIMSPAEQSRYRLMTEAEQVEFQKTFWAGKPITEAEFFERLARIDAQFGSGKRESGLNTDQGRVYLSLGPPNRVTHLPSSRTFFPLEIWYYESVPAIGLSSELRLIFYLKNGLGYYKLYSPTLDTMRALMTPQANTIGMFGPNQEITQADLQTQLTTRPAENEVAEAATSVSPGITDEGNEEILFNILSPAKVLSGRALRPHVRSRFLPGREAFSVVEIPSAYGGTQVDVSVRLVVEHVLRLEVSQAGVMVYQSELHFNYDRLRPVQYVHRLDLLSGRYSFLFSVDDSKLAYPVTVVETPAQGQLFRAESCPGTARRDTPFSYSGDCVLPAIDGPKVVFAVPHGTGVAWAIHQGTETLWKAKSGPGAVSVVDLPDHELAPGNYQLDATDAKETRTMPFEIATQRETSADVVSYNANLGAGKRLAFVGHQWLLRGELTKARASIKASLAAMPSGNDAAWIELSRVEALSGQYDDARSLVGPIVQAQPKNVDALVTLAFIEAKLQDYPVAASLYRRALTVQNSPEIRIALARLDSLNK